MAAIASINASGVVGAFDCTESTLSASDTITIAPGKCQLLVLRNATAGSLTATIDGADGTTDAAIYNNSGGAITLNISGGGDTPTVRNGASAGGRCLRRC